MSGILSTVYIATWVKIFYQAHLLRSKLKNLTTPPEARSIGIPSRTLATKSSARAQLSSPEVGHHNSSSTSQPDKWRDGGQGCLKMFGKEIL